MFNLLKVTSLQYLYNIYKKFLQFAIILFDESGQTCPKYPKKESW